MWFIEDIELVSVELDFSSSGLGRRAATAVHSAGIRHFNAIELIDVEPSATQVELCKCCGCTMCADGNFVMLRRLGNRVVWLPAWEKMELGAWEASMYAPPRFMQTNGAPIFSAACWDQLRALNRALPPCQALPAVSSREVARLFQLEAPGHVLGEFPMAPRVRRDLVVAVAEGDLVTEIAAVDQCLQTHFEVSDRVAIVAASAELRPMEFWLDLPGVPEWKSFAHIRDEVCFLLDRQAGRGQSGRVDRWLIAVDPDIIGEPDQEPD